MELKEIHIIYMCVCACVCVYICIYIYIWKLDTSMRQLFCDSEFHAYAIIRRILNFASSFFIRVLKVERFPLLMESKLKT